MNYVYICYPLTADIRWEMFEREHLPTRFVLGEHVYAKSRDQWEVNKATIIARYEFREALEKRVQAGVEKTRQEFDDTIKRFGDILTEFEKESGSGE